MVVHIPVRRDEAFNLYRFVRLPFFITNLTTAVVGVNEEFIAINRDHSKVVSLTSAEFSECHSFNNTRICPQAAVTKKAPTSTCLGALFQADLDAIPRRYDLGMVIPDGPMAAHISGCSWCLLLPWSVPIVHACNNGLREVSNGVGELIIVLDPSCNAAIGDQSQWPFLVICRIHYSLWVSEATPPRLTRSLLNGTRTTSTRSKRFLSSKRPKFYRTAEIGPFS